MTASNTFSPPKPLDGRLAAVDGDGLTCQEVGSVQGQITDQVGELLGLAHAPRRYASQDLGGGRVVGAQLRVDVGREVAGRHSVQLGTELRPLRGGRAG